MANQITYKDNSEEVIDLFHKALHRGLQAIGMTAETHAKKELYGGHGFDTGLLRNSITYAIAGYEPHVKRYRRSTVVGGVGSGGHTYRSYDGTAEGNKDEAVYLGTNVEYAPFVENGTSRSKAIPFLKPAATEHSDEYKRLMKESMENA